ncbi:MAG: TIGR01777 family oxidoreductase [Terracidiphilus sp.]|nr:TIGR01777 family oxidoreductase [Terracidiphilus sp.]
MNSAIHASEQPGAVLLSGASGMLGSSLRQALMEQGVPVRQLVRGTARAAGQIAWNPAVMPAVHDTAELVGCAAAIHLSGASVAGRRWTESYRGEMTVSRVDTTRALAETMAGLQRKPRVLVVASAVGIYGDRGDELLDESSQPGTGFLADLCRAWEAAAAPAVDAGIRVVHARLGVVLGRGGALEKMLPAFRLGLGGPLGNGRQWMSWVSLEDAIAALLFAVKTTTLTGAMNVTSPEPVTNAAFTRALGRVLHRPAMLPVPAVALQLLFGEMADETLLASQRAVPSLLLGAGFRFAHATVDEALRAAVR